MDLYPYMGFWIYMVVPIFNFFRIFILFFIMSIKLIYPTIHVCVGHLHVFFGKMSNQFPFPFLNWIVYYFLNQLWFLYISDINPLSDIIILILMAVSNLFYFFLVRHISQFISQWFSYCFLKHTFTRSFELRNVLCHHWEKSCWQFLELFEDTAAGFLSICGWHTHIWVGWEI